MKKLIRKFVFYLFLILFNAQYIYSGRGPTQPEAAKFEPVDATDLVSLYTGNFTYNIPLFEVMGPEGGWPINIFYHAGIGPNTEASWVGLGWDLNPGSINRFMNGYPDDYWGGTITSHYHANKQKGKGVYFGVSLGPVGLNISYDCYTGQTGVNASLSVMGAIEFITGIQDLGIYKNNKNGIGMGFDTQVHIGTSGVGISADLSVSLSQNLPVKIGVSAPLIGNNSTASYSFSSSGFSISSSAGGTNISVGGVGVGMQSQSRLDSKGSFTSSSWGVALPVGMLFNIPLSISFGSYEWEWWLDEVDNEIAVGSIHQVGYTGDYQLSDIWGQNTDNIIAKAVLYSEAISYATTQGGSPKTFRDPKAERSLVTNTETEIGNYIFSSEDAYQVGVQGLAGVFKPYFENSYLIYDVAGENGTGNYELLGLVPNTGEHIRFRFEGDNGGNFVSLAMGGHVDDFLTIDNNYGSKKIKPAIDMETGNLLGFEITVADGKIYEFYQPIFSYYSFSFKKDYFDPNLPITSKTNMKTPYATSWLITGIKGPDYIDRGESGFSADDWGFWIKFRYESSSTFVPWRTPHNGTSGSIDPVYKKYKTESEGLRDNIYLESIETATHIAHFIRSNRNDDQNPQVNNAEIGAIKWTGNGTVTVTLPFDKHKLGALGTSPVSIIAWYDKWGYEFYDYGTYWQAWMDDFDNEITNISLNNITDNNEEDNKCEIVISGLQNGTYICEHGNTIGGYIDAIDLKLGAIEPGVFPSSSKKLDKITLHKKVLLADGSFKTDYTASYSTPVIQGSEFDYNYELQNGAPNSLSGKGKLTLASVQNLGYNQEKYMPAVEFVYGYNPDWSEHTWDIWGGYTREGTQYYHMNSMKKSIADEDAGAWCLTKIINPLGAVITVEYESDYIDKIGGDTENKLALFTPWFYQRYVSIPGDPPVQPEEFVNYFFVHTPNYDYGGKPFSDLLEIFNQFYQNYNVPMPACVSYYTGVEEYSQVGQQNSVHISELFESNSKVQFLQGEDLPFSVSDPNRQYIVLELDPYDLTGNYPQYIPYLFAVSPNFMYGGGHRVKSISVSDISVTKKTEYKYNSGFLTVMPSLANPSLDWPRRSDDFSSTRNGPWSINRFAIEKSLMNNYLNILGPSPMVGYDKVEVYELNGDDEIVNGKTSHEFYTAEDFPFNPNPIGNDIEINDHSNMQGRPKKTAVYGLKAGTSGQSEDDYYTLQSTEYSYLLGSGLISNNINVYLSSTEITNPNQPLGLTQRKYLSKFEGKDLKYIDYQKEAVFQESSTIKNNFFDENYNQTGFVKQISSNIGFEARTGNVLITQTYTPAGDKKVNEVIPAYWFYPELKNKNMLTQEAEIKQYNLPSTENFISHKNANTHNNYLVAANVTTWKDWSNNEKFWHINDSYNWIGKAASFEEFDKWSVDDPGNTVLNKNWQRTSNITMYDRYSHPLEERDLTDNYISSIYGHGEALPIAIISNARHNYEDVGCEASFVGFESGSNQLSLENDFWGFYTNDFISTEAHSGNYSFKILGGNPTYGPTRDFLPPDPESQQRKYRYSFWYKTESGFTSGSLVFHSKVNGPNNATYPNVPGASQVIQLNDTQGIWEYVEGVIDLGKVRSDGGIQQSELLRLRCYPCNNSSSKYLLVDDFRFQPLDGSIISYTYLKDTWKLSSITDQNNVTTSYEYDDAGRLVAVRNQDNNILKAYEYKFGRIPPGTQF